MFSLLLLSFCLVLLSACTATRSSLVCVERRLCCCFLCYLFGSSSDCFESGRYLLKAHAGRLAATNSGALILVSDILSLCCVWNFCVTGYPVLCKQVVCGGIMSDPDVYIYT